VSALPYEPFVFAPAAELEWFVERVPCDNRLGDRIDGWKQLVRDGWDVTALLAPDSKTVLALGCRGGEQRFRLGSLT
jgi:hypothetical protein